MTNESFVYKVANFLHLCFLYRDGTAMGQKRYNDGIAMLTAMVFLAIMVAIVGIGTVVGLSNYRLSKDNKATIQAEHAADSAIEHAIYEFWHLPNYHAEKSGLGENLAISTYKGILDGVVDVGTNLTKLPAGIGSTFGQSVSLLGELDNGAKYEAAIRRKDAGNNVILNVVAKGLIGSSERYVTQTLTFGSANPWDFAILTDNIECTFCHLEVYSLEAGYRPDGQLRNFFTDSLADINGFERVRVGSIAALNLHGAKHEEADSYIMGTIYTAQDSNFISDNSTIFTAGLQPNTALVKADTNFSNTFKQLSEWDSSGTDFVQDCDRDDCAAFSQMYTHYPEISEGQPDGLLQDVFPLPVEDRDGNRLIDDTEWDAVLSGGGSVSVGSSGNKNDILSSTNTSGIILIPHTQKLGDVTTTHRSFDSVDARSTFGGHHAILRGTDRNPLNFDGKVYVNGDVVISGRVAGDGMIVARGNIYIVGDIVYDCGSQSCDYTQPYTLPRFALSAVGNITSGIYPMAVRYDDPAFYTTSATSPVDGTDSFVSPVSFYKSDGTTRNYRFDYQDYGTIVAYSGTGESSAALSSTQMTIFNKLEYDRAIADDDYIPRFYLFRQGQHDWIYKCHSTGCWMYRGQQDNFTNLWGADPSLVTRDLDGSELVAGTEKLKPGNGKSNASKDPQILDRAVFVSISPKDHWLLGAYGIDEVDFNTQFPGTSCVESDVETYISTKLFSTDLIGDKQKLGETQLTKSNSCYDVAVARERLRAMNAEVVLKEMWRTYVEEPGARDDIINSTVDGDSFRLDGIVYTGNAYFFISPGPSVTKGEAVVNGSFIAADMGVLVGGTKTIRHGSLMHDNTAEQDGRGLRVQYDRRLIELISDVGEGVSVGKSSFEIITANEAQQILGGP